jgi:hypothetical protein
VIRTKLQALGSNGMKTTLLNLVFPVVPLHHTHSTAHRPEELHRYVELVYSGPNAVRADTTQRGNGGEP